MPALRLSQKDAQALWEELGHATASRAARALWKFVTARDESVTFFRKTLRPVSAVDRTIVDQLILNLDNDRYIVRKQAMDGLEQIGDLAGPALRQTLKNKPTLEVKHRVEQLLQRSEPAGSPERLRMIRAIEVLERIGTPAAVKHLQELAGGAPEALLTREAKASLARMRKQAARAR
jgi:hypothetical protein